MTTQDQWERLRHLFRSAHESMSFTAPEELLSTTVGYLNEISRAAEACGIGRIDTPPGAYDAIKSAIESLAKSPHSPHATAMSVLLRVLPVLEEPTLANEAKMMNILGVMSRRHEEGTG